MRHLCGVREELIWGESICPYCGYDTSLENFIDDEDNEQEV